MKRSFTFILIGLFAMAGYARADEISELPAAQLKFAAGDYQGVVLSTETFFPAHPPVVACTGIPMPDALRSAKYQLRLLRAESLLKLYNRVAAATEFSAAGDSSRDFLVSAQAHWTARLLNNNPDLMYHVKHSHDGQAFDLTTADGRKGAMKAEFDSRFEIDRKYIEQAAKSGMLPQIRNASRLLFLEAVSESIATDSTARTDALRLQMANHLRDLVEKDLADIEQTNRDLQIRVDKARGADQSLAGTLTADDQRQLRNNIQYLGNVHTAVDYGSTQFVGAEEPQAIWKAIQVRIDRDSTAARSLLEQTR